MTLQIISGARMFCRTVGQGANFKCVGSLIDSCPVMTVPFDVVIPPSLDYFPETAEMFKREVVSMFPGPIKACPTANPSEGEAGYKMDDIIDELNREGGREAIDLPVLSGLSDVIQNILKIFTELSPEGISLFQHAYRVESQWKNMITAEERKRHASSFF